MNGMDHHQAIKTHAAERYLLDELPPEDRDNFEEHYFMCSACAEEVRSAFAFADNVKVVLREQPETAPQALAPGTSGFFARWSWLRPSMLTPALAALLLGVTLYQNVLVIPRIRQELAVATQPRVVPTVVARTATRGEDRPVDVSKDDRFLQVILDIAPAAAVSSYTCEVYDAAGGLRFTVPARAPSNGDSLHLSLPVDELESGKYAVRIRPTGEEYSFTLHLTSERQ